MKLLLLEPWFGGSHRSWAEGLRRHSAHDVQLLAMPPQFWKWRMQGGSVTLARRYQETDLRPDLVLASDMLNLAVFRALLPAAPPLALYMHENQLSYPQNARQRHGWQYGIINWHSALVAERVLFNSEWHREDFLDALSRMLRHFGERDVQAGVAQIRAKSAVLAPGMELRELDRFRPPACRREGPPLILWNHRWDGDKNPRLFFAALSALAADGLPFRVAVVGASERQSAPEFEAARQHLGERVLRFGYVESRADYARLLWEADYVISTALQEYFGMAVIEAIYCGCVPLLPWRLNYPQLIPPAWHAACLYRRDRLAPLLLRHLTGQLQVDTMELRHAVARYDWSRMAPLGDRLFEETIRAANRAPEM